VLASDGVLDRRRRAFHNYFVTRFPSQEIRPVWNLLRQALLEQCEVLDSVLLEGAESETEARSRAAKVAECIDTIMDLSRWLDPSDAILTEDKIDPLMDALGPKLYAHLSQHCGKRAAPGRPIERRDLAIRALELKSVEQAPTWINIARQLCPCGEAAHDKTCVERIRRDVNRLKDVLLSYRIRIPVSRHAQP
jgi:hypothetical protein